MYLLSGFSSLMEVGVGLSLAFAVLRGVREQIRIYWVDEFDARILRINASDSQQNVIKDDIGAIKEKATVIAIFIENLGLTLSIIAVVVLLVAFTLVGFDQELELGFWQLMFVVICPCFVMPFFVCVQFFHMFIQSLRIDAEVVDCEKAFKRIKKIDRKVEAREAEENGGCK